MGPNGVGQVDAVARDHGPARLRGHRRLGHARRRRRAGARRRGSGPRPGCSSPCSTRPRCPACRSTTCSTRRSRPRGRDHRRSSRERCVAEAGAHRLRRALPRPAAQRRPVRRREEAQRDAAARRARSPKIAILDELDSGPRRRRPARLRPAGRGRPPTRTGLGVLAITHYSRLLARAASPTSCTSWSRAGSWRPAAPSWPTSSRTTATPRGPATRPSGRRARRRRTIPSPTPSPDPTASGLWGCGCS